MPGATLTPESTLRAASRLRRFIAVFGPGLVVMLADTDVGSVITAGQSGVQWGYRLLLLQLVLVPILYMVQELTVRLAIFTGRGHGELIRETFGPIWAWVSAVGLGIATIGALLTEFSGVTGVGELYGLPRFASLPIAAVALLVIVLTGSYRRVERFAIAVGLFELAFFFVAWAAHPDGAALLAGAIDVPFRNPDYLYLAAANIGAVIMPWMVFYQQSAVVDKGLGPEHLRLARWDTAIGALITQLVMIGMLVTVAATLWAHHDHGVSLQTVREISDAITRYLGPFAGRVLFSLGMVGAALIAAIVASLTAAWGIGEVTGYKRSLEHKPSEAPWFYVVFTVVVIVGALVVISGINLVQLNLYVQVMNALLLPIVLTFLYLLARKALPDRYRLAGRYRWVVLIVIAVTASFGVYAAISGIVGGAV
jgi:NRAMP (natural resistance-associated macrophage protein)-like metal ion transporter